MNSFSILPFQHQSILDAYQQWLVSDLYQNHFFDNLNDPNFLQKLSLLQAEGIRHDIGMHAAVTHGSIQEATSQVGQKIQSVASLITSSLDEGFSLMNNKMTEINVNLQNINSGVGVVALGVNALNQTLVAGLNALNSNISQVANVVKYQIQQVECVLRQILVELKIPESQRERRYHIEEGMKYFNKGMRSGDCLYFEDALDEFNTAISIERKDFFSWYYIGMIHLYSKEHLCPERALSAFNRYIHYADALPQKHNLFDEAWLMKAECKYLMQDFDAAFKFVEKIMMGSDKAALRGMKYLSASNDRYKQQQAVEILKHLMQKNPYIVMQVLEDYDLVSNGFVVEFLDEFRNETKKEINNIIASYDKRMEPLLSYPLSYYQEVVNELNSIKSKVSAKLINISIIDAIILKEEIQGMSMVVSIERAETRAIGLAAAAKKDEEERRKRKNLLIQGYVDLGLPSGKVWKNENEKGFYSYDTAVRTFGDKIPSREDWIELKEKCRWEWSRSLFHGGYKITGPNGASIFLPTTMRLSSGGGKGGSYLSSTYYIYTDEDDQKEPRVVRLFFSDYFINIESCIAYYVDTVRLAY